MDKDAFQLNIELFCEVVMTGNCWEQKEDEDKQTGLSLKSEGSSDMDKCFDVTGLRVSLVLLFTTKVKIYGLHFYSCYTSEPRHGNNKATQMV